MFRKGVTSRSPCCAFYCIPSCVFYSTPPQVVKIALCFNFKALLSVPLDDASKSFRPVRVLVYEGSRIQILREQRASSINLSMIIFRDPLVRSSVYRVRQISSTASTLRFQIDVTMTLFSVPKECPRVN